MIGRFGMIVAAITLAGSSACLAQSAASGSGAPAESSQAGVNPAGGKASDSISLYFPSGSAVVTTEGQKVLDKAARTYEEGKPIIMVVSGSTDATGSAQLNLRLSQERADNVLKGLVDRGIPVGRFQVLAKGETEPAVPDSQGKPQALDRRVEISWR